MAHRGGSPITPSAETRVDSMIFRTAASMVALSHGDQPASGKESRAACCCCCCCCCCLPACLLACERLARHEIRAAGPPRASRPRWRENRWLLPGLVVDLGAGSVLLDRVDPVQRGRLALLHFTGGDDLTVGGHQVEVVLAVR